MRKLVIISIIVLVCFAFLLGQGLGFKQGIEWTVKKGLNFVDFQVDAEALAGLLYEYRYQIDYRYP